MPERRRSADWRSSGSGASIETAAHLAGRTLPSVRALGRIALATGHFRMAALQSVTASDAEQEALQTAMGSALEAIEDGQKHYEPLIGSASERDTYSQFMSAWSDYMLAHATAMQVAMEGSKDEARVMMAGDAQTRVRRRQRPPDGSHRAERTDRRSGDGRRRRDQRERRAGGCCR